MTAQVIHTMSAEEYHALPRLSASGIKKLIISAQDFWKWSWFNQDKEEKKSDALNLGTAYHVRILEGREEFDKRYAVKDKIDGRTKEGKAYNEQWRLDHPDAEPIDERTYKQINAAAERIASKPEYAKYFIGGKPEVAILWNDPETNVPMKARLDYLIGNHITDLKTMSNNDRDYDWLVANHIVRYGYNVQAAVYREALKQATGADANMAFVFQTTGQINNTIVRHFPADLLMYVKGHDLMRQGINKFRDLYHKYGSSEWFDDVNDNVFTDESFPLYALD